jgi:ABC-type transport system involved in cytochrome bd biosynthesis fused ATPase/permease subunit
MGTRRKKADDAVVEVTSAPTNRFDEIDGRERRYLIAMGIRMLCFIGAVILFQFSWVAAAILLVAAFLLPMFAVVVANSASPRIGGTPVDPGLTHRELGPGDFSHDD